MDLCQRLPYQMTRRENLLAALAHRKTERLPAFFVADGFNQPQPLPSGLGVDDPYDPGIMRFLGGDVVDRLAIGPQVVHETPSIRYSVHRSWWLTTRVATASLSPHGGEGERVRGDVAITLTPEGGNLLPLIPKREREARPAKTTLANYYAWIADY